MKRLFLTSLVCTAILLVYNVYTPVMCQAQYIELGKIEITDKKEPSPYSSNIITEEEIEKENPKDTGEILKKIPGISARRTGPWGLDPSLRGLKEDQINVLIDGVKIWGACPGRMDPPSSQAGPEELEAIEVIKGPFSVRHGSGAMGGIINLVTKQPKRYYKPEVNGSMNIGYDHVANGKKGKFSIYGGDKPYDYRFSFGGRKYEDYETPSGKINNSGFKDVGYSTKLGFNLDSDKRLDLSAIQNLRKDVGHPARPMDSERARNTLSNIKYTQEKISPWLILLTGQAYYNRAEHIMNNDNRATFNTMPMETESETNTYGGKIETVFELNKHNNLASGIDFYRIERDADKTMTNMMGVTTQSKPWDKARIHDWGFYSELKSAVCKKVDLQIGARADLVEANSELPSQTFLNRVNGASLDQKETNLSGNIAVAYAPSKHYELTAGVGRGVRTADVSERYSNVATTSKYLDNYEYLGNPALEPEKSLEFDVSASAKFERVKLKAALFYNHIDDYIGAQIDNSIPKSNANSTGVKRYTNMDATIRGVELEGEFKLCQHTYLETDITYTEGENRTSSTYLAQIAPLEANVRLGYAVDSWWTEFSGRFVSKQDKYNPAFAETETPGFATFGLVAGIIPYENYSIIMGVENMFDKKYSEHLNATDTYSGGRLLEPGRNIFVRLKWDF